MLKCDLCGKTKEDVKSVMDGIDGITREVEDKVRWYVEDYTSKEISWMPRLCSDCKAKVMRQIGSK